jgi:glycosyltransferase involved in cell wall biosynthesis
MKVLFVACQDDPYDHNAGSGMDYELYHGLERHGVELVLAGPFPFSQTIFERVYRRYHSKIFRLRPLKYPESFLSRVAKQVEKIVHIQQPDLIFSKYLPIIAKIKTDIPIVVLSDTTIVGSQREWPIFTKLAFTLQKSAEQTAYSKATRIIVFSDWTVNDLIRDYSQPRSKIFPTPIPASIPEEIIPTTIKPKDLEPLKLLLVGREYHRKGIDIALEVTKQLNRSGHKTLLRIVGLDGKSTDTIQFMGLYNKTIPEQLQKYVSNYAWANFLIHPARFEAAGIVPSEAAGFGVPTITNNVGGLGTTVADGVSGVVLPRLSPPEEYVKSLIYYIEHPEQYINLCKTTRERYQKELNWGVVSKKIYDLCLEAAAENMAQKNLD